jgi:hypothetical protein
MKDKSHILRDLRYGDFGSRRLLRIDSDKLMTMTYRFMKASGDDPCPPKLFQTQHTFETIPYSVISETSLIKALI